MRAPALIPILALILSAGFSLRAEAARVSLVGAVNSSEPNVEGSTYTAQPAIGGGVLLEMRMVPMIGLELGALYLSRKYESSVQSPWVGTSTVEAKMLEFPVLLRAHLGRVLSLGLGGYYASAQGNLTYTYTANGVRNAQDYTYRSQNYADSDYGLVTSGALYFSLAPLTHFVIDGRYTMGIKDIDNGPGVRKFNDLQLLAGLQFGF